MGSKDLFKRLSGVQDSRATKAILARGANVYNGGSSSAHGGPISKAAIARRRKGLKNG